MRLPVLHAGHYRFHICDKTAVFWISAQPAVPVPSDYVFVCFFPDFFFIGNKGNTECNAHHRVPAQPCLMDKYRFCHHGIVIILPWLVRFIVSIKVICGQGGKMYFVQKSCVISLLFPIIHRLIPGVHALLNTSSVQPFVRKT